MVPITDRTVKVSLVAQVNGYIAEMQKAAQATKATGTEAEKLAQKKEGFQQLGLAVAAMGAVAAAGVAIAIKKFADWDAQMSQVQSLSHATAAEMNQLRDASLNMGQAIGFSATQVADAETELVKAGVSVTNIIHGGLVGALNLAAAGQIDVAQATQIAGVALTQFKLAGKDVPHLADLLAAGADKALGGVDQLGQALNQGGLVAAQFGLSIDDTVGTLAAFANAGLLGSDAGTSFKQMLLSLASPSQKASDTMKSLGINAYDASGSFVGITNLAGQLHDKLLPLPAAQRDFALSTIFGSDAIRTSNVLMQQGSDGIRKWINNVNDQGFAAQQAAGKMNNLNGDLSKLSAAFDTAIIKSGSGANDTLRGLVQGATDAVHWIGELPQPVLTAGLGLTALAAAIGLVGGGALLAIPKIAQFKIALETLNITGPNAAASVTAVGTAMRALPYVAVLAWLAQVSTGFVTSSKQALGLEQSVDSLTKKLSKGVNKSAIDSQLNATVVGVKTSIDGLSQLTNSGWLSGAIKNSEDFISTLEDWNPVFKTIGSGTGETTRKVHDLDTSLANMVKSGNSDKAADTFDYLKTKTDGSKEALQKLNALFPEYAAAQKDTKAATEDTTAAEEAAADSYKASSDQVDTLTGTLGDLIDQFNKLNGTNQDAVSANAAYQDALAKVKDTIKQAKDGAEGYSTSLDANTQAGADNLAMFGDLAQKSQDAAKAQFDADQNSQAYVANLQAGRQTLIDRIMDMGATAAQAGAIADQVYRIPTQREVDIIAKTAEAAAMVQHFHDLLNSIPGSKLVSIGVQVPNPGALDPIFKLKATGGAINGPGGPRDDRAGLFALSNGEHVLTAADVAAMGGQAGVYAFRSQLHGGRGFADGGEVKYVPGMSYPTAVPNVTVRPSDRPIYMDGQLFGMLREMASGEAQIVLNADKTRDSRRTRMGS